MADTQLSGNRFQEPEYLINPKKTVLWLLIVASVMLFAGFTSAYIVRRGEGNWEIFALPSAFIYSTILIVLSSLSMQFSLIKMKQGNKSTSITLQVITLLLGIAFCISQFNGWQQLRADNVYFSFTNPSNPFVYVITGMHVLHAMGGILFLLIMLFQTLRRIINSSNTLFLSMCNTYWHFVGILWIYLYIFLTLYR
ncbi:MAG: cytochrome c oxidase subunit 3 [Bacteroidetes bacterium]|mgnify:CR=1 FL=1|nr:cytochrome c oxidase subunit 3 [Bacteroidota bacterium]